MNIFVVHAVAASGDRHELNRIPTGEDDARRRAGRAAALLTTLGTPGVWAGGRVVALEAGGGRLVAVARVSARKAVSG